MWNRILAQRSKTRVGKTSTEDAVKSREVFLDDYTAYRNERGPLGGVLVVFILVPEDIFSVEQFSQLTNCEIDWVQIHLKGKKSTDY